LINASPDLARQIESATWLQPRGPATAGLRNSPIAGALLTNSDIDHALGLLLLRQHEKPLVVYATDKARTALGWLDRTLARFCGIEWRTISSDFQRLNGSVAFRAIELPHSVAFQFLDEASGRLALVAPAVGEFTRELSKASTDSDIILFDGTFWSDHELASVRTGARSSREMNHLPIGNASLELLRQSPARRKIYTHINNTNPILMPGSSERAEVEKAGIEIARDGLEIVV
jgi:pyrroloquinoline quinone biosynthesis protein B